MATTCIRCGEDVGVTKLWPRILTLVLGALYWAPVTPVATVARLLRQRGVRNRRITDTDTYWIVREG